MADGYRNIPPLSPEKIDRFWRKVALTANDNDCWLWTASKIKDGYGSFRHGQDVFLSHRVSYLLSSGVDPNDKEVCHSCDTPQCVNPAHLFIGSHSDNMCDMVKKDRFRGSTGKTWVSKRCGEQVNTSKLSASQVECIREMCASKVMTQAKIAEQFGVNRSTIQRIFYNKQWKHI